MEGADRVEQARDKKLRRDERARERFEGSLQHLQNLREALHETLITTRRERITTYYPHRAQRVPGEPKAPPPRVPVPRKTLQMMTLPELREVVRTEEQCENQHQAGYYVTRYSKLEEQERDRVQEEEDRRDRLAALEAEQRNITQRKEREAREKEELQRQAASTEVPAQTDITSGSTSSTSHCSSTIRTQLYTKFEYKRKYIENIKTRFSKLLGQQRGRHV
eukprot:6202473-Amphidinium_carterae.1